MVKENKGEGEREEGRSSRKERRVEERLTIRANNLHKFDRLLRGSVSSCNSIQGGHQQEVNS